MHTQSYVCTELSSHKRCFGCLASCVQAAALFCSIQSKKQPPQSPCSSLNSSVKSEVNTSASQICICHLAERKQVQSSAKSFSMCLVIGDSPHDSPSSHINSMPTSFLLTYISISKLLLFLNNSNASSSFAVVDFTSPQQENP